MKIIDYVHENNEADEKAGKWGLHSVFSIMNCTCPGDYGLDKYENGCEKDKIGSDGYDCLKCWMKEMEDAR